MLGFDLLDFIVKNYMIFIVIAIVLLLGLLGYIMDKKKYIQYREEILNEGKSDAIMNSVEEVQNVAPTVEVNDVENTNVSDSNVDPLSGNVK